MIVERHSMTGRFLSVSTENDWGVVTTHGTDRIYHANSHIRQLYVRLIRRHALAFSLHSQREDSLH